MEKDSNAIENAGSDGCEQSMQRGSTKLVEMQGMNS